MVYSHSPSYNFVQTLNFIQTGKSEPGIISCVQLKMFRMTFGSFCSKANKIHQR